MNDHFSNLVTRARATEPALRPNLATSFASPREIPSAPETHSVEITGPETEPVSPPSRVRENRRPSVEARNAKIPQAEPTGPSEARVAESREPISEATPVVQPSLATPARDAARNPTVQPGAAREANKPAPADPVLPPQSLEAIPADEESIAPTMILPSKTDAVAKPAASGVVRSRQAARASNPAIHPATLPLSNAVARPASPTVHVTIGRLEIRAAQPRKAPPAPPPAPRLSLDDYLRRGNGGAR